MELSEKARPLRHLGIEFFVIVLGVLIALAVDRCVQDLDEGSLEQSYLEALLADFQSGAEGTAYAAEFIRERMGMIEALIDIVETGAAPDSVTAEDMATAIELAGWHPPVTFPRVTWDDLINTGRLGLITNGELRRSIADFYSDLDWYGQLDANWRRWMEPAQREAGYVLSPAQRLAITRRRLGSTPPPLDAPPLPDLVAGITDRPETLRNLGQALIVAELAGGTVGGISEAARAIAAQLEAELAR